jgi:hypothetical protein
MKKLLFTTAFLFTVFAIFGQTKLSNKTHEQKLNDEYATGLFHSAEGTILDVAASPAAGSYFNILNWLEGRVSGLQVVTTRTGTKVPYLRNRQPTIFVDENPVNVTYLSSLPTSEIAMVKVIKTPFLTSNNSGSGAIAVYTYKVAVEGNEE